MTVEHCFLHHNRVSIEKCEVCERELCGSCLWYADTGERLCPIHGEIWREQGHEVHPPERYADAIAFSEISAFQPHGKAPPPYQGNSNDLMALLSIVFGIAALLSCVGAYWLLPLPAFALGLIAWLNSRYAHDPGRTRWLSGIGMASGGVFLLGAFGLMTFCAMCWVIILAIDGGSSGGIPPTPFLTATPFPGP